MSLGVWFVSAIIIEHHDLLHSVLLLVLLVAVCKKYKVAVGGRVFYKICQNVGNPKILCFKTCCKIMPG